MRRHFVDDECLDMAASVPHGGNGGTPAPGLARHSMDFIHPFIGSRIKLKKIYIYIFLNNVCKT